VKRAFCLLATTALLLAQQATQKSGQKKQEPAPAKKEEPKPLFGGQVEMRSSSDRKESAALGFKGIDPSGKVDQQMMAVSVSAADQAKLKQLAQAKPSPVQVAAFLKEGGLKAK